MMDLIERAASALENLDSSDYFERQCKDYPEMVRAVLMAVREPSEEMKKNGAEEGGFDVYRNQDNTEAIWKAMIDAALNQ